MNLKSANKIETNRWELEIEIPPEEFNAEVDKSYNKQKKNIIIPGFRKGKAPRNFIEKYYGEGVFFEDAVNALYPQALEDAAKDANIDLIDDHIDFDVIKMTKADGLIFKAKVTVMPEVKIENYKGITAQKRKIEDVKESDIEAEIKKLQERMARHITKTDEPAAEGDIVNIDFEGFSNGEAFEGGTAKSVDLKLGSKQFIPGFEEQTVGHNSGDEFEINVNFPADYHAKNLAGKEATFKVKINRIQKCELPKIDDEFVKDISEFNTVAELKFDIKNRLETERTEKAKNEEKDEIMKKFVELIDAEIPEALVKHEIKILFENFARNLQMQGLNAKDYMKYTGTTPEQIAENFRPQAEVNVKIRLGFDKISDLENFEVTEEEIEEAYKKIADEYKMDVEKIKAFNMEEDMIKDLKSQKAENLIINSAEIK